MLAVATCVLIVSAVVYAYQRMRPPPPKTGPPVTSPRIRLSDGRHLAYRERGVLKENARYKVILVHGYDSSKDLYLPLSQVRTLHSILLYLCFIYVFFQQCYMID